MPEAKQSGYEELEHTADWALKVWAPDLEALFGQAAIGMNDLAEMELSESERIEKAFTLEALDAEGLLVEFLSELLYYSEMERLGFDHFELEIGAQQLTAKVAGSPIAALKKEIKAVTFYDLEIEQSAAGLEVVIVFDV
ncbi:MAG: archease [Anaerolineales bacterium]|nr:archease [Anaerolineales bacterium]